MDDTSVCTLLSAQSDAQHYITSTPNAASVTDADKVINTKIASTQVEGDTSEEELLKGLLTDSYCHVCEAVLLFESQRLSHYEGKKHAQKLKVYLQTRKEEKMNKAPQKAMTTDKDRFCELCNMVFSSQVVARSHYEGKVHTKNLRKQGLRPPDKGMGVCSSPSLIQDPDHSDQMSSSEGGIGLLLDPAGTTATQSTEADLKDPNKHCSLCASSFNTPQMAAQHYNGRKHQRNQARQELLKELGDGVQQGDSLMCQMCSVQFNSVEMYQAHMQGSKHQIKEKKVVDLCKSQQKVYTTFSDELADYIQVQQARGIKTSQVLPQRDTQENEEGDEGQKALNTGDAKEWYKPVSGLPPTSKPLNPSRPGSYNPAETWRPSYPGPPRPSYGWNYNLPLPVLPSSGSPQVAGHQKRGRHRRESSSSSYTTSSSSSSYSSCSSSTSDSGDSECRLREKKRKRKSRKDRGRRGRDEESEEEWKKGRKRQRRERDKDSEERRREQSVESGEEGRRKGLKNHGKRRRKEKKSQENFEMERGERVSVKLKPQDTTENRKETELQVGDGLDVEQREGGDEESAKTKHRKEKKKVKDKVDTRTEEEKLWDDSILGC
ncbi:zinc finger matrin-type protein 1 [Mugil cephalus]|uniref:zinc finger matrin-type protein 1 n=1 Tax=Mugil cephalus TaxID=48193 RepID=UPI001FB6334A|nr:zinc finger matrin-type protein 1 [Mugil cephalus]